MTADLHALAGAYALDAVDDIERTAVSPELDAGVAMLAGLQELRADRVFQLWLLKGTDAHSAAVLTAGQRGGTVLFDWQPGADRFALSVEPGPAGSTEPTQVLGSFPLA